MGPYVLLQELGQGGMGAVYVAEHVALRRRVALKLRLAGAADDEGARRFLVEAQAAARLRHPGIVAVHETGRDAAGQPWIAMDLVEGEPLDALVERAGPLPPEEVVRIGLRAARALAHAHAQGILHRDLKPGNLLLRRTDGAPLLVDFGLAKLVGAAGVESLTKTGDVLGTPAYMPPEQANGEALDARADVWSLGATLYYLAVGRAPFGGGGLVQTLAAVLKGQVVPPRQLRPDLPADLEAVLLRCLTADRARRCPSATALADELERLSRGEESQALGQARARGRRRLLQLGLGLGLASAALGAGSAALLAARRPVDPGRAGPEEAPATSASSSATGTAAVASSGPRPGRPRPTRHVVHRDQALQSAEAVAGLAHPAWIAFHFDADQAPPARWCPATAYDPLSRELYVFGGRAAGVKELGDLWSWNGATWWRHGDEGGPSPRIGHAMVWDTHRQRLVLVGGTTLASNAAEFSSVWELDGDGWTEHAPAGGPGPRAFHGLAYDPARRRALLFGGSGLAVAPVDDSLWSWDGAAWTELPRSSAPWPSPRRFIGAAWDAASDSLFVAGDSGTGDHGAELWRWRPGAGWTTEALPGGRKRELPALAVTPLGLVLFGGGDADEPLRNDGWCWREGAGWAPLLGGITPLFAPYRRRHAALTYLEDRRVLVLVGGTNDKDALSDLWELTLRE